MTVTSLLSRLRERMRAFCAADAGNVAITFALATIPIIGFTGAAIDYSRANSARTAMQAAADSTALILSKEAQNLTDAQLKEKALKYFIANFNRSEVKNIVVTPVYKVVEKGSFKLDISTSGTLDTTIAGIFMPTMDIAAKSQVQWGLKKLELALALDNTGSMAWSKKMDNLKKAAKELVNTLEKAAKKDGDVRIAIIPFDTRVNLGKPTESNPWDKDFFDVRQLACGWERDGWDWKPIPCKSSDDWQEKSSWDGCVRDRTYSHDVKDTAPDKDKAATKFPAFDCGGNAPAPVLPLTSNWSALRDKIEDMRPIGNTNVAIGLAWGWHALTPSAPLGQAKAPANDLDKVLIILTDGDNTESWDNKNQRSERDRADIDARTELACQNVKASGIKVYAIRVIDGNADLLRKCATNSTMYYDVQDASELNNVFSAIAQNLASLRLAK